MGKKYKSYADYMVKKNLRNYSFYFKYFYKLLLNMFKWENLPDDISSRFLEERLIKDGIAVFHKSNMGFFKVSSATPIGLNGYDEAKKYLLIDSTGYRETLEEKTINKKTKEISVNCVPIWNNNLLEGEIDALQFYATKLESIDCVLNSNLEQLKNPYLISCPESQRLSVEKMLQDKERGLPYIIVNDDFQKLNSVQIFDLHVQDHLDSLEKERKIVFNEALTMFGINNVNVDKKERLTKAEGEANNEEIDLNKSIRLIARQEAANKINSVYGTNIQVNLNTLLIKQILQILGGEVNE